MSASPKRKDEMTVPTALFIVAVNAAIFIYGVYFLYRVAVTVNAWPFA